MADLLFDRSASQSNCWQDREIRFDVPLDTLDLRRGETLLDSLEYIEDTKGNNGDQGDLRVTNLRIMWISRKNKRTNISIGHNCVISINVRSAKSRLKGETQALYILTKLLNQRFEFIFTAIATSTDRLFSSVQSVFKAYDNSRLYRDMKLRGAVIADKELRLLPLEQVYSRVNGVWNLSAEQGNLGTFFISNVRVVWFANLAESFNVSIPYLQIKSVKIRDSKFGPALVIDTMPESGGYVLGFRIDPRETLDYVFKELSSLWQVFTNNPIFGVEFLIENMEKESQLKILASLKISDTEQDVEIVDTPHRGDHLASFYAEAPGKGMDRDPVFCPELGLAIEQLREGTTIDQLWSVL